MTCITIMIIDSLEDCKDTFPVGFTDSNCYNQHMPNCSDYKMNGLCNSLWEDLGCIRNETNITGLVKEYCQYSCRYYGVDCSSMLVTFIESLDSLSKCYNKYHLNSDWLIIYQVLIQEIRPRQLLFKPQQSRKTQFLDQRRSPK